LGKYATITKVGGFDEQLLPKDWEFADRVRKPTDATKDWLIGGYNRSKLEKIRKWFEENGKVPDMADVILIIEDDAPKKRGHKDKEAPAPAEPKEPKAVEQASLPGIEPPPAEQVKDVKPNRDDRVQKRTPKVFNFYGELITCAAKVVKERGIKELKFHTTNFENLEKFDQYVGKDVRVVITLVDYYDNFDEEKEQQDKDIDRELDGDVEDQSQFDALGQHLNDEGANVKITVQGEPDLRINDPADHTVVPDGEVKLTPVCKVCGGEIQDNICVKCGAIHIVDAPTAEGW